jgi:hypothetical protein
MTVGVVSGSSVHGTLMGAVLSAFSMALGAIGVNSAAKTQKSVSRVFNARAEEKARRSVFVNKLFVVWGASGIMEWVSSIPGSVFSKEKFIFSIFNRSMSCLFSIFRIYSGIKDLIFFEKLDRPDSPAPLRAFARNQAIFTSFSLMSELCFIAYFALELASALLGYALFTGLSGVLVLAGIAFLIAGIAYMCCNDSPNAKTAMWS